MHQFKNYFQLLIRRWIENILNAHKIVFNHLLVSFTPLRLTKPAKKPHFSYTMHMLNLEVNRMFWYHHEMYRILYSVHETLKATKNVSNLALLLNITDLRHGVSGKRDVAHKKNRCSGEFDMHRQFLQLSDEFLEVIPKMSLKMYESMRFSWEV